MKAQPQKILIVKMSSLGDVIHTLPALATLRKNYPQAFIAWVIEESFQDLLHNNPDLDEVIVVRLKHWRRHWDMKSLNEFFAFFRKLRRHRFDVLLDFQGLIKSGLIAFLSGIPQRMGYHPANCRERMNSWFTNWKVPFIDKKTHSVDKNLFLVKTFGAKTTVMEYSIMVPKEAEESARHFLRSNPDLTASPIVGIHPGVGYKIKSWELSRFAELSDRIAKELGCNILLTWGPGEEEKINALSAMIKSRHWTAPPNNMANSLALFKRLNLLVSCDTGPVHICASYSVPTVAIHGPTDPSLLGPRAPIHEAVYQVLPCSFCYKRSCPTQNECMTGVTVEDVFKAVKKSVLKNVKIPQAENFVS